jgi:hypothetical protein
MHICASNLSGHQRIQAAQQMLVRQRRCIDLRHAHRLQPAQHPQFGVGIAQAVEDHDPNGVFNGCGVTGFAKDAGQCIKTELFPKLVQRPHIAQHQGRLERHLWRLGRGGGHALGTAAGP